VAQLAPQPRDFLWLTGNPGAVIQKMLRHKKSEITLHYVHGVNQQQMDAQKMFPDAIGVALDDRISG
jgi:hypothetical protein